MNKLDEISLSRATPNSRVFKSEIALKNISSSELLKGARTLSDKMLIFKDKTLSSDNKVDFSDYNKKSKKIFVWVYIENKTVLNIYDKNQVIYCFPKYKFVHDRLFFTELLIDDKKLTNYSPLYEIKY